MIWRFAPKIVLIAMLAACNSNVIIETPPLETANCELVPYDTVAQKAGLFAQENGYDRMGGPVIKGEAFAIRLVRTETNQNIVYLPNEPSFYVAAFATPGNEALAKSDFENLLDAIDCDQVQL